MHEKKLLTIMGMLAMAVLVGGLVARTGHHASAQAAEEARLAVVWSSGDPDVAHRVCLMYAHAAFTNNWFDEVRLVVGGPSARLLAADKDIQAKVKAMMEDGVIVQACIACADSYGVADTLRGLGIEVKGMGKPLTDMLRDDYNVLTF